MKIINGNLLTLAEQGQFDVIVHGVNCFHTMGSGIARQIKIQYPGAFDADLATDRGTIDKLGTFSQYNTGKFIIANCYTQHGFNSGGANEDVFEYTAFKLILEKLAVIWPDKRFGFPLIGCGFAGGDESRIVKMINDFGANVVHTGGAVTIVKFQP